VARAPYLPDDPLERFCELYAAVFAEKRWFEDAGALRYAALSLASTAGRPGEIARRMRAAAEGLKERAGWFGALRSDVRFLVAASLVREGLDAGEFCDAVERGNALFKEQRLTPGKTSAYSALAMLILMADSERGAVEPEQVARMRAIYDLMRGEHAFLTGRDDYPAAALLVCSGAPLEEIARRVEEAYSGLLRRGFSRGNPLQLATHVLFFNPCDDREALDRFRRLFDELRAQGLHMHAGDYADVALLSFLPQPAGDVARRVLADRRRIRELRPKADPEQSFDLACGTVFLHFVRRDAASKPIDDVRALMHVHALLQAQQAAVIAASSGAAAAAVASG